MGRYDDIMNVPRPESKRRAKMSVSDRAAQFSSFAALTGYEDAIEETARLTDRMLDLSEEELSNLDLKLQQIVSNIHLKPCVVITYFVEDALKAGGRYVTVSGNLCKYDPYGKLLRIENVSPTVLSEDEGKLMIPLGSLLDIDVE